MRNKQSSMIETQQAIVKIMEGTSGETGKKFFRSLVKNLSIVLDTAGAWVTEFHEDENRLKAFAFWLNGAWVENYEYALGGTPCEPVINNACRIHIPEKVVELYPEDRDMQECGAVSYLGEPLKDSDGIVIGHLAILDTKPMPEDQTYLAIFRIFSARAGAELTRLKTEQKVREREEKLARLVESAMDGIVEFNEEFKVTQINPAALKILGYKSDSIRGTIVTEYLEDNDRARLRILAKRLISLPEGERYLWIPGGLTILTAQGKEIKTEATLSHSEMHGDHFFTLIFRNINDRLEAEKKINALSSETEYLREELRSVHKFGDITGSSEAILRVLNDINQVAGTDSTVLITGETGTGKELIARAIHSGSRRNTKPLIKVNCAAIPANLIESEFFGHEKGAFTGATAKRDGRFRIADRGTIFLDEIGELPLELQSKLLRVLQEGEFEPVGSSKTVKVSVRVIAATNRDLRTEAEAGNFREDLYYRLSVFPIYAPPLRDRAEDIVELAEVFIQNYSHTMGKHIEAITQEIKNRLMSYKWPGNVRELQNVMERALITSVNGKLNLDSSLPLQTMGKEYLSDKKSESVGTERIRTAEEMSEMERKNIILALEKTNWKVSGEKGAARLLGIPPTTLSSRIKALKIRRK